jgi:hypothetical protein
VYLALTKIRAPGWLTATRHHLASVRKRLTNRKRKKDPAPDPALVEATMAQERAAEALRLSELIKSARQDWLVSQRDAVESKKKALLEPHESLRPQRQVPESERVPVYENAPAKLAKVAPEMREFLDAVTDRYPDISITSRRNHGGAAFKGAGFSVDITLPNSKKNERRYYDVGNVMNLLKAIEGAAVEMDARWRVLYDDAEVQHQFNASEKRGWVTSQAKAEFEKEKLNFHGPGELLLHLHLDVSLPPPAAPEATPPEAAPPQPTPAETPPAPEE